MLAADGAAQLGGGLHHHFHGLDALLHHGIVVGIKRNIGVHVAVARVHVKRNEDAPAQHAVVDGLKERALGIFPEVLFGQSEAELVQLLCSLGKARV